MTAPAFKILKGNPSDSEVAALTTVFTQLANEARAKAAGNDSTERNLWGRLDDRYARMAGRGLFNPSAFRNVRFY